MERVAGPAPSGFRGQAGGRGTVVRAALVGGPMYDPLYESIPAFEQGTGIRVEVVARLPHPELNAFVRQAFGAGDPGIDLLSTHTKYAPSQARWLSALDDIVDEAQRQDLLRRPAELATIGGRLLQVPRNVDVRLLHYRRDLLEDPSERAAFERKSGRPLRMPATWGELVEVASFFTRPGLYGFLFPGRDSGLFGTFYELLVGAGGELFDASLRPAFDSPAGVWAASTIAELHHVRAVTPRELPRWHYDEISAAFRAGEAAMVCDWPGSYHLYRSAATCRVPDHVGLAPLPAGPAGVRAAYAGCHSFAIPASAPNRSGAGRLLTFLTSFDAQLGEARRGAIPCRASALARVRQEADSDAAESRRWALLADAEKTMIIPPRFATYPGCEDAIWHAVQRAMQGEIPPAEAVRQAAADVLPFVTAAVSS
ncbi:MAG TPA: extracellular solute-binding protein [Vicinamibacterales bacterium]|nr:extracellular solute-binding protein [Vicinamibacterales bacterium]